MSSRLSAPFLHRRLAPWLAGLFLLHHLPFAVRPNLIGGDEPHYAIMAHSIASDFDLDVRDDYVEAESGSYAAGRRRAGEKLDRHVRSVNGSEVFAHPLGLPVIAAPILWLVGVAAPGASPDIALLLIPLLVSFAALWAGWWLVWQLVGDSREAALLVFSCYFSSPLWFYSRTLFTEPLTWSFAVLAVACIAKGRPGLASLFLALALAMKETALLLVVPILFGSLAIVGFRSALLLTMGPLVFAIVFMIKNVILVGTPFSTFYPFRFGSLLEGVAGLLVDSAHGVLWFAPLLMVAAVGWLMPSNDRTFRWLARSSLFAFLAYFAITAAWIDWRGGSCFGPRLLLPAIPALMVPLVRLRPASRAGVGRVIFHALFVIGFVVQWCAALDPFTAFWGPPVGDLIAKNKVAAVSGVFVAVALFRMIQSRFPVLATQVQREIG